jgi:hypothetical protein
MKTENVGTQISSWTSQGSAKWSPIALNNKKVTHLGLLGKPFGKNYPNIRNYVWKQKSR